MEPRTASHQTQAAARHDVDGSGLWDFQPQQHVMTCDQLAGTVVAVHDGPFPGSEEYEVQLDGGLGGGRYTASQLSDAAPVVASAGTAPYDYPELGQILVERPDPAKIVHTAATKAGRDHHDPVCAYVHEGPCPDWAQPGALHATAMPGKRHPEPKGRFTYEMRDSGWPGVAGLHGYLDGQHVGDLYHYTCGADFDEPDDVEAVRVNHLHTKPEHQGSGAASAMMDALYKHYPRAWINHGQRTEEGSRWWDGYHEPDPGRNVHNVAPGDDNHTLGHHWTENFDVAEVKGEMAKLRENNAKLGLEGNAHQQWDAPARTTAATKTGYEHVDPACAYVHEGSCPDWASQGLRSTAMPSKSGRPPRGEFTYKANRGMLQGYLNGEFAGHISHRAYTGGSAWEGGHDGDGRPPSHDHAVEAVKVKYLHTNPDHQGHGVASAMMDALYHHYPNAWINHGYRTNDGSRWWDSYDEPDPGRNVHNVAPEEGHPRLTHWSKHFDPGDVADDIRTLNDTNDDLGHEGNAHRQWDPYGVESNRCEECDRDGDHQCPHCNGYVRHPDVKDHQAEHDADTDAELPLHTGLHQGRGIQLSPQDDDYLHHEPGSGQMTLLSSLLATAVADQDFRWHITAAWSDVVAKAKRIRKEGGVRVTLARDGLVVGEIRGDHHVYETGLQRLPGSISAAHWSCGCKWGAYHWGADDDFSRFSGRMCSHALALQYEAQSRGMFGRDITMDTAKPSWVPRNIVVKWDIDADRNELAKSSSKERGAAVTASSSDEECLNCDEPTGGAECEHCGSDYHHSHCCDENGCEHCGEPLHSPDHSAVHEDWLHSQTWHTPWEDGPYHEMAHTIHRGMSVELPKDVHKVVHDDERPMHERAQALVDHLTSKDPHIGTFWSDRKRTSEEYAVHTITRSGDDYTPVVFHARKPELHHIMTDPEDLDYHGVYSFNHVNGDGEQTNREVPLQGGAPVHVTGVSWMKPTYKHEHETGWVRHDFDTPQPHQAAVSSPFGEPSGEQVSQPRAPGATSPRRVGENPASAGPLAGADPVGWDQKLPTGSLDDRLGMTVDSALFEPGGSMAQVHSDPEGALPATDAGDGDGGGMEIPEDGEALSPTMGGLRKGAARDFSAGERQQLIQEGDGVGASNLDRLQIQGTHYEQLAELDREDPWWMA